MNILSAATVPAVFTLLLTGAGWLFDRSVQGLEKMLFLQFSTSLTAPAKGDKQSFTITLHNNSHQSAISSIRLLIYCPDDVACLTKKPKPTDGNQYASYVPIQPWSVEWVQNDDTNPIASDITATILPLGASAAFNYTVTTEPEISFFVSDSQANNLYLYRGFSLSAWISSHYYQILFLSVIILIICLTWYLLFVTRRSKEPENVKTSPNHDFILIGLGRDHRSE